MSIVYPYKGNKTDGIPMTVYELVQSLINVIGNHTVSRITYFEGNQFIDASFSRVDTISDFSKITDIGWTVSWFQTFESGGYIIEFQYDLTGE